MQILPVDSEQRIADATAVLTLAFVDDPVTRWMYPRPAHVLEAFPRLTYAFSRFSFEAGDARIAADGRSAAVWVAPGSHIDEEAMGEILASDVAAEVRGEAEEFFGQMDAFHPGHPHWYLPLLGVEPGRRGQGRGGALLTDGLRRCDEDGVDVYLDSTNPRNVPLYERHGFEVLGTVQVGSSPPIVPMLRPARP